jgi:heme exporter protein A
VLELRDIAAFRGERLVFEAVSFRLEAGEALVLTGANGSGKTTLLRLLAGFVPPAAGSVLWQGAEALGDLPALGRRTSFLGHQDAVKAGLTVAENLSLGAAGGADGQRVALETMALADLADLPARFLSAGQKRRLAIARLLLQRRPLWLLDEPTTALDAASVAALGVVVEQHRAAGGIVVAATHLDLPLVSPRSLRLGE